MQGHTRGRTAADTGGGTDPPQALGGALPADAEGQAADVGGLPVARRLSGGNAMAEMGMSVCAS